MLNRVTLTIKVFFKNNIKKYNFTKSKKLYNEYKSKNIINFPRSCNHNKITTRKFNTTNNSFKQQSNGGIPPKSPKIGLMCVLLGTSYFINKNNKK